MNNPQQFLFPRLSPVLRCSSYGKRNEYILIFSSNSKRLYFTIWLLNTFADLLTSKIFENGQKYLFHIICNILYWIISFGIRFWNYIIDYMMIFSRVSIACKVYWIKILLYRSLSVVREKSSSPKLGRAYQPTLRTRWATSRQSLHHIPLCCGVSCEFLVPPPGAESATSSIRLTPRLAYRAPRTWETLADRPGWIQPTMATPPQVLALSSPS